MTVLSKIEHYKIWPLCIPVMGMKFLKILPTLLTGTPCLSGWVNRRFGLNGGKQIQKHEAPQGSTKYKLHFSNKTYEATLESKNLIAK
jgi:hypothetical protein